MSLKILFPERLYYRYRCLACSRDEYRMDRYELARCAKCSKMMYQISREYGREILKKGGEQTG